MYSKMSNSCELSRSPRDSLQVHVFLKTEETLYVCVCQHILRRADEISDHFVARTGEFRIFARVATRKILSTSNIVTADCARETYIARTRTRERERGQESHTTSVNFVPHNRTNCLLCAFRTYPRKKPACSRGVRRAIQACKNKRNYRLNARACSTALMAVRSHFRRLIYISPLLIVSTGWSLN